MCFCMQPLLILLLSVALRMRLYKTAFGRFTAERVSYEKKNSVDTVDSPQDGNKRMLHVHLLVESIYIIFQKYILRQGFRLGLVLNLFLIFHQTSGLCSYKVVPIKNSVLARFLVIFGKMENI